MENESQSGRVADREDRDLLKDKLSYRGGTCRMQRFKDEQVRRPQEKLSRMSREQQIK